MKVKSKLILWMCLCVMIFMLLGCGKNEVVANDYVIKWDSFQIENGCFYLNKRSDITEVQEQKNEITEFTPRDKHIYNSTDADKNLLLQFLNDEIPIINYIESGEKKTVYYSELDSGYDYFYIVDMDGDGKKEFCIFITAETLIIKYNEQKESFEVWLRTRIQEKPIGNGKTYAIDSHTDTGYSYYEYDENGELIEEKYYSIGRIYDENNDEGTMQYLIGTKVVSKEEWEEETAYLFDMMEAAPSALTYDDLLK